MVAIMAVLATAIAAGSGSFSSSTSQESARTLAEAMMSQCRDYKAAAMLMTGRGCKAVNLDVRPPAFPVGTSWTNGDYTAGNGTNRAGNGSCALYDIRGGGLLFNKLPDVALDTSPTALTSGTSGDPQMQYWFGYPILSGTHCVSGVGRCPDLNGDRYGSFVMSFAPVRPDVCAAIDDLLKNGITASGVAVNINDAAPYNMFNGGNIRGPDYPAQGQASTTGGVFYGASKVNELCAKDFRAWNGGTQTNPASYDSYVYYCTVLVR